MRLRWVLFTGWLFWFLFFLGPVDGATVTIAKDVVIGGPYGRIIVTNNEQIVNWFATYANGTIYFDVAGVENVQRYYEYRVVSWGNGTMLVKFGGLTPVSTNQAPRATYVNGEQQFRFTSDEVAQLCIAYVIGFCGGGGGGGGMEEPPPVIPPILPSSEEIVQALPNVLLGISIVLLLVILAEESGRAVSSRQRGLSY